MLYRPEQDLLWDTWLIEHEGLFHLFYIRISAHPDGTAPNPETGDRWNGISKAVSPDLLHWKEVGPVLEKHPEAVWLGTGMIHRVDDWFVMNFSEERPVGHQVVCFARSRDLTHWERLPETDDIYPDPRFYQSLQEESADPLPRWDSLGVIPPTSPGGQHLGLITANARGTLPGHCGTLGLLRSEDGLHWEQLPPAIEAGLFPSFEVPEHVMFGGRHYAIFSTNSVAGPRFDSRAHGPHGGTYYVVGDAAAGPYALPPGDPLLLGQRDTPRPFSTYVGRYLQTITGEHLLYHQWMARTPVGWWGPPKVLVERAPYQLGLDYWPGCDALKATLLAEGVDAEALLPAAAAGRVPVIEWSTDSGSVVARNQGGAHAASWRVPSGRPATSFCDLADGRVLEMDLRIRGGRGLGVWVRHRDDPIMLGILLNAESGSVEIGTVAYDPNGASLLFSPEAHVSWPIGRNIAHSLRVLARRHFLDIYIDDRLAQAFVSHDEIDPTDIGFYAELATGDFLRPRLWAMA